jgi:hypothetical protein
MALSVLLRKGDAEMKKWIAYFLRGLDDHLRLAHLKSVQ